MEFFSDHSDVYLNGKLQSWVVGASQERGEVLLMEQDYRLCRDNPDSSGFIPSDHPTNNYGYATIVCRGEVVIIKKQTTTSPSVEWLEVEEGVPPTAVVLTEIELRMIGVGKIAPYFECLDLGQLDFIVLRAYFRFNPEGISLNCDSTYGLFNIVVPNAMVDVCKNSFSDPTLSPIENLEMRRVDIKLKRGTISEDTSLVHHVISKLCLFPNP